MSAEHPQLTPRDVHGAVICVPRADRPDVTGETLYTPSQIIELTIPVRP